MKRLLFLLMLTQTASADPNRLSVLGGWGAQKGYTGTSVGAVPEKQRIVSGFETGPVYGIQYQRLLNERVSIGVQGQTNDTLSFVFGVDF